MSLRDRIKHVIDCVEDQDDSVCMDAAAAAILALVRDHMLSEEAGKRGRAAAHWKNVGMNASEADVWQIAILAALGDTE